MAQNVQAADPDGRLATGLRRPGAPVRAPAVQDPAEVRQTVDDLDRLPSFSRPAIIPQDGTDPDDEGEDSVQAPSTFGNVPEAVPAPLDGDLSRDGVITDGTLNANEAPSFDAPIPEDEFDTFSRERRPRPAQLRGAFDPTGIRYGSFIFLPEAVLNSRYTDNVLLSERNKQADVALELRPSLRVISDWNRHEVELNASGLKSYYRRFKSENELNYDLRARARLDIRRRTNVEGELFTTFAQESRGSIDVPQGLQDRPDTRTHGARLTLNQRFNRLSLRLRGQIQDNDFEAVTESSDALGAPLVTPRTLDERDFKERTLALRGGYEVSPALTVFAEGEANRRDYDTARDLAGVTRDSDGYRLRGGIEFDNGSKLRGTVSVGYGSQSPKDARLRKVDGFLFDANIEWRPREDTTVRLTGRSDISETTVSNSAGSTTNQVGVEVRHALRRYLLLTAAADFQREDFSGVDVTEDQFTGRLEMEYLFNQEVALLARYQHTKFLSSEPLRDYDENELTLGVRVRR